MGTENVVRTIKVVHPSCVVMVKIGNFYNVYSKDAYIFSYLFKYKIKENYGVPICGFPITSIGKVQNILEKSKINYIIVDKRSNYEEEYKQLNNQENNYDKIYEKAEKSVEIILRVQKIYDKILKEIENKNLYEILDKIEMILKNA